jgi:hypothetical protein
MRSLCDPGAAVGGAEVGMLGFWGDGSSGRGMGMEWVRAMDWEWCCCERCCIDERWERG